MTPAKGASAAGWGMKTFCALAVGVAAAAFGGAAQAQRADENAVRAADDAFGVSLGNEKIGIYNDRDTRGFSPVAAGNVRMEGLYYDMRGNIPSRVLAGSQMRVGLTAQGYPFPAPTGIVDYQLKTAQGKRGFSALAQIGPNEGYSYELDALVPLQGDKLAVALGAVVRREEPAPGLSVQPIGFGIVPRWRPAPGVEIKGFYGHAKRYDSKSTPTVFTSGAFLPPEVTAQRFSQDWAQSTLGIDAWGVTGHAALSEVWRVDAGLFRYYQFFTGNVAETYLNADTTGLAAARRVSRDPENALNSYSGEARLTASVRRGDIRQTMHFSVRARDAYREFGGASTFTLGPAQVGPGTKIAEPTWVYGVKSLDQVRQTAIGVDYVLTWRGIGEAGIGLQKVNYKKVITKPGAAEIDTAATPLLPNASVAITVTPRLAFYASATRGLEDSNLAPDIAVNASEPPPAIATKQRDIGLRYALTPHLKLVAGYFEIEKPYYNLDPGNLYRQLGMERHAGGEFSLSGSLGPRVTIVAGAVLMKPQVTGEAVSSGQIGARPVGQADTTVKLNVDYRLERFKGMSLDAALTYASERAATSRTFAALGDRQLETAAFTTLDLGMRYRFTAAGKHATLRVQALNVADAFAWQVQPTGGLYVSNPRAYQASLAMDF